VGSLFTTDIQDIGWMSCALGGGSLVGLIAAGFGVRYLPRMKYQMLIASLILVAFVSAIASSTEYTRTRSVIFLLVGAAAAGYVENLTLSTMALVWDPEDIGLVSGVLATIRTAAGSIAIALYSSLLSNGLTKYLPEYVPDAAIGAGLPTSSVTELFASISAGSYADVPGITPAIIEAVGHAVKQAYSMSFRTVFLATLPFGAILLVSAYFTPNVEEYLTDDVARKLQDRHLESSGSDTIGGIAREHKEVESV
jgi:hypothetical protein